MLSKYKKVRVFNLSEYSVEKAAEHGVHADGGILTAKMAFFVTLFFSVSWASPRLSSRRYREPLDC